MKTYIKKIMDDYEKNNPHEKHLNDLAIEDIQGKDRPHPGRPLIMHAAYGLDGGLDRKDLFHNNYDNGLEEDEKDMIDEDILELAEINGMLHHPEAILDPSMDEHITENRQLARDILQHLVETKDPEGLVEVIKKELYKPLLNKLLTQLFDRENILYASLHPTMVKNTEHLPEHYGMLLNHMLMQGALDASHNEHWEEAIPRIFNKARGLS